MTYICSLIIKQISIPGTLQDREQSEHGTTFTEYTFQLYIQRNITDDDTYHERNENDGRECE